MTNMPPGVNDELFIEGAKLIFKNFEGRATPYRPAGIRDFSVALDRGQADELMKDGWNVKIRLNKEAPDDLDEALYHLPVTVRFGGRPPTIWVVTSRGRTKLPEDDVDSCDWLETTNVDLKIRPHDWKVNGNSGRKAYLKIAYFTLFEDPINRKYEDVPDLDLNTLGLSAPKEIGPGDDIVDAEVVDEYEDGERKELTRGSS